MKGLEQGGEEPCFGIERIVRRSDGNHA